MKNVHIKLIALNARYIHSCPALFYVRRELARHLPHCSATITQFTINDPYFKTLLRIAEGGPFAVFFSVYVWNSDYIKRLIADLVRIIPTVRIVLGGPQAPFIFRNSSSISANRTIVRGEIEGVPPVFYRDLDRESLAPSYTAATGESFPLPFKDDDFDNALRHRHIYYESSRGCPFSCAYCLSSIEHGVRYKDIGLVKEELREILRHEPKVVRFVDRTFNALPERALTIWRFLAGLPGKSLFHFEMAPDRFTEDMFSFLADVETGRFQFEIGMQSTSPRILAAVNRHTDLAVARDNIARLAALDRIHLHVDLILGLPFDTEETFRQSCDDIFALGPHYIQMGLLKILPGTALAHAGERYGMINCERPPYEIMATRWLDHETLSRLHRLGECVEAFYNNRFFRTVLDYLRRRAHGAFALFSDLLGVCQRQGFFELAPTQELMSEMLLALARQRADQALITELLVFDWLRSGQRSLPAHLRTAALNSAKRHLRERLPQNWEGRYDYRGRDEFFKRAVFARFSGKALLETGLGREARDGYVCFPPEKESGVFGFRKVFVIPPEVAGLP